MKNALRVGIFALCLCLLLVGCGKAQPSTDTNTPTTNAPKPDPDLTVEECFAYGQEEGGTYGYNVSGRNGSILCSEEGIHGSLTFTAYTADLLMVEHISTPYTNSRWVRFVDIEKCRVSNRIYSYLATVNGKVAYLEQRTNAYHVFVVDPFNAGSIYGVYTLEGLTHLDGAEPLKSYGLTAEGALTVTYDTAKGEKTMEITVEILQNETEADSAK